MILAVGGMLVVPQVAEAQGVVTTAAVSLVSGATTSFVNDIIANVGNFFLWLTSWFVALMGVFLSVSINLTIHIKDIYGSVTGIQSVWVTIRDLSSIFIIFLLMYSAIAMILGASGSKFGGLVVKIFLAGIFINFSLFFVRITIDASNLVSLQFYQAIAPNTDRNWTVGSAIGDGGLSNVFMQSLKLPTIYKSSGLFKGVDVAAGIGIATAAGIIMMIVAGLSFMAAAIAFTARTAILLFVMALSPLLVIGMVFPEAKKKLEPLMDLFKGQLLFMPVYLGLMYVALRIISDENFTRVFNPSTTAAAADGPFGAVSIGVVIQYAIALLFINAPLVAAISFGGVGMGWAPGSSGYNAVNKWIGTKLGGVAGRNTIGRVSRGLGGAFDNMAAAAQGTAVGRGASTVLRAVGVSQGVREGLKGGEDSKYGSTRSLTSSDKEDKERAKDVRKVILKRRLEDAIANNNQTEIKEALDKMSDTEIAGLGAKILSNSSVIPYLSGNVYKNVDKGDKTEADKVKVAEARFDHLKEIAGKPENADKVRSIVKNMSGEELESYLTSNPVTDDVVGYLRQGHLKDMDNLPDEIRKEIGDKITNWSKNHGKHHPAQDHINKNRATWGQEDRGGGGNVIAGPSDSPSGKKSSQSYG